MTCDPKLYVETVVKKTIPAGVDTATTAAWLAADVIDFDVTLTLTGAPATTVTYNFIAGDIVVNGLDLLLTIPSSGVKSITTPGTYSITQRMTDAAGIRGLTPCPDCLEFFA